MIRSFWVLLLSFLFTFTAQAMKPTLEDAISLSKSGSVYPRYLVMKTKRHVVAPAMNVFKTNGAKVRPMFSKLSQLAPADIFKFNQTAGKKAPQFHLYNYMIFDHTLTLEEQIRALETAFSDPSVEYAYFEVKTSDAVMPETLQSAAQLARPANNELPGDFESAQYYLNAAPEGVGAREAWNIEGGTGKGIRVVDIENGWDHSHLDFESPFFNNTPEGETHHHGTAVWGEIAARRDGIGMTGISYDVEFGTGFINPYSWEEYDKFLVQGLEEAISNMSEGDILVIEQHFPMDGRRYGPVEYMEPVFEVLKYAVNVKGIHCIAAAGNGYTNLDDPTLKGAFDLGVRDSGCVMVGAALPPSADSSAYTRCGFSNYGSRLDAFGYGNDVPTAGYGDYFYGKYNDRSVDYTLRFSGTSSATPIVAGAVASVLGIAKAKGVKISPLEMRKALRATGTPQRGKAETERIGNLPSIQALVEHLGLN